MKENVRILYDKELNPAQLDAVNFMDGALLVIAGAGSGKTRTLTYRVARLVEEGYSPASILLLTFTRKASQEMLQRATSLLDNRCGMVSGGTFHSFANSILRRYANKIGYDSGYSILDRTDAENLISMVRNEVKMDIQYRYFPKKRTLANIFSAAVNKSRSIEEVVLTDYPHFEDFLDTIIFISNLYKKQKTRLSLFDYDDLLVYLKILLEEHPDIGEKISSFYRYIMVDEYQDTNSIQAQIVYLLSQVHKNIMVVGDDSQSIYAFRGANFKNIMKFPEKYPGTKIIRLEENYRSVQPILDLTNMIIEQAREKYTKVLFTRKLEGNRPLLVKAPDENSQSGWVVKKISQLNRKGIPLNKISVLFRAGFHSFDLELELSRAGIPFIKVGGFKFLESAHIKDVLAHFRVIANPYDSISWYRILLLLDRIGPSTAKTIYESIVNAESGYKGISFVKLSKAKSENFNRLKKLILKIDPDLMTVVQMGELFLNYYTPILEYKYDDHPKRLKDLKQLITIMERYSNIHKFLADMVLEPPNISSGDTLFTDNQDNDRLVLSTVHSAKGLEWHTVFIIWALDGRFPSVHAVNDEKALEEELRLMYVAATRAQENLFFLYPAEVYDRISGMILNRPSCFLDGIPDNILEKCSLRTF